MCCSSEALKICKSNDTKQEQATKTAMVKKIYKFRSLRIYYLHNTFTSISIYLFIEKKNRTFWI